MSEMTRIAVDAMGGDLAPAAPVKGSVDALAGRDDIMIYLVGKEDLIKEELAKYNYPKDRIEIVNADEVIEMAENPTMAIRRKKKSSIVVGMNLVRRKEADAFVSAGNSGAILVGGQMIVGRIHGIMRAPFAPLIPTEKGVALLLDAGANVDARAEHLVQFAQMGSIYMSDVLGIQNPRVGLINCGAEEEKGNALVKETMPLLRQTEGINFIGSVEARQIPEGYADVCVCEGFTGNMVLKTLEGTAGVLIKAIKSGLKTNLRTKIGALLILPALKQTLKTFDASSYGGAPMLGLNGLVVKTHGNAKAGEVTNTIYQCVTFNKQNITGKIRTNILGKDSEE